MPQLTIDDLDVWIGAFRADDLQGSSEPRAIDTSWDQTTVDTALIVVRLDTSGTEAYLQRSIGGAPEWSVVFEARDHDARLSAEQVMVLAAEVSTVGRLCAYLSERTAEHMAAVGVRRS